MPPDAPLTVYSGLVMHQRMRPKAHRFSYRVYSVLMDLDRQEEITALSPLVSHNKWNLFSVHGKDHGAADGSPLRPWADKLFEEAGLNDRPAKIYLLCYPRILGAVFNPLSVYYGYDADGQLTGVIYEVRNTFGERHSYVAKVEPGQLRASGLRQSRHKQFFVSPLMDMAMRYDFNLKPPGEATTIRILEHDAEGPILAATFHGMAVEVSSASLISQAMRVPFQTLKVVGAIHYEALRLWLKGIKLRDRPPAPPRHSVRDRQFLVPAGDLAAPGLADQDKPLAPVQDPR
ncbi:MAG: DUF1365 domain-containing protein [Devosiaceae bacterium]|nr:DUF1365 domain-containing protein [Devosiaceae bacterium MH13]